MNFEVDRHSSAWANIALCADLTWTTEPPDDFVIANQRLWNQNCRISKALQNTATENSTKVTPNNLCELADRRDKRPNTVQSEESAPAAAAAVPRSVSDVIPESRLARFYGNFYYDERREKCYINENERCAGRYVNGHDCDNSDLAECWMLPEVEYLFRKLTEEASERDMRRRRPYSSQPDDFERWGPASAEPEAAEVSLARRVRAVRALWDPGPAPPSPPTPPATPRKMRTRRRQPRRSAHLTPSAQSSPRYCLDGSAPVPLLCDPSHKFDAPRPLSTVKCQRAMARFSASVQAAMHASRARLARGRPTFSRFVVIPHTSPRCELYPQQRRPDAHKSPRQDANQSQTPLRSPTKQAELTPGTSDIREDFERRAKTEHSNHGTSNTGVASESVSFDCRDASSPRATTSVGDTYVPLQSSAVNAAAVDDGSRTRRLYSTVLSMSAPRPLGLAPGVVRLSQKQMPPGLLKLNPKIILPATRFRTTTVDKKFDELEKEALEQYKPSDESIDTKFSELEKQAVEQYKVSNSNTSCSSGNSGEKSTASPSSATTAPVADHTPHSVPKEECTKRSATKFHKDTTVGSVVIHSQNFPALDAKGMKPSSVLNLKNFPPPQRGEKKQQNHKPRKNPRSIKSDNSYAASDTDYEARALLKSGLKVPVRWAMHVAPPKKRMKKNVTMCVSELLLDRETDMPIAAVLRDVVPSSNHVAGRAKMSAHGAGDIEPAIGKI